MSENIESRQKYHAGIAPHQPDRGLQDWEQVEDPEGECGGVFEVPVKDGQESTDHIDPINLSLYDL